MTTYSDPPESRHGSLVQIRHPGHGGLGGLMPGTLGRAIGGAINGCAHTGTARGCARGFAAGLIPQDLGLKDLYKNNAAANIAIGITRDGIRGAIVADSRDGILSGIAIGQINNAVGHIVGYSTTGTLPAFKDGAFVYEGEFWRDRGAITFGNVISGRPGLLASNGPILRHERDHINSPIETALGVTYPIVHAIDLALGRVGHRLGQGCSWHFMEQHVQKYPYSTIGSYCAP